MLFKLTSIALFTIAFFGTVANSYKIPCTQAGTPKGCAKRVTKCTPCKSNNYLDTTAGTKTKPWCIQAGTNYECSTHINPTNVGPGRIPTSGSNRLNQDKIAKWYQVQWTSEKNECFELIMQMGESWGKAPNGEVHDCRGRCGMGCGSWATMCSNYGPDCLKHDVCAWYHESTGIGLDGNCADEYGQAVNDYATDCIINSYCQVNDASSASSRPYSNPSGGFEK